MLARLMGLPGIGSIDVDHTGTLMRLRISDIDPDPVADAVLAVLRMEGYAAKPLAERDEARAVRRIEAWHGTNAAAELSREEARVLADEAVAAFARERPIGAAAAGRLRRTAAERLYRSFTAADAASHPGELIARALPEIAREGRTYLNGEDADALGPFLGRWNEGRRTDRSSGGEGSLV